MNSEETVVTIIVCICTVCEDCQELHHGDCPVHGALVPLPDIGNDHDSEKFTKVRTLL